MSSLDLDTITQLLEQEKKPQPKPPKKTADEPKPHEGPLGVLLQSDNCKMCARGDNYRTRNIRAMYTVNGTPLCTPHAMYVLSCICVENGYEVQIESKVENVNGSRGTESLPGDL